MDQKGPRVRVRKIVRCPATDNFKYISVWSGAIEVKYALAQIKQAKGSHHPDDAQHRGDPQHQAHVPSLGLILVMNIVIGDGEDGAVIEQRDHHDHDGGHWIEVKYQDRQRS